jgi:tetratricopeptide (TPR) repeat protein
MLVNRPLASIAARSLAIVVFGLSVALNDVSAQTRESGEVAWARGHELALAGQADSALAAYARALEQGRTARDPGLASAARLGMAEVFAVLLKRADSADVAYQEAVQMAEPGDFNAIDAYVRWLSSQKRVSDARALHRRAYDGIDVPRAIKRESVSYLLGEAAMQVAAGNASAALSTLTNARDIANRLASGDGSVPIAEGANAYNYWVLHDLAVLRMDSKVESVRNTADGTTLRAMIDTPAAIELAAGEQRFAVARLADRIAQARRMCRTEACAVPPSTPMP